MATPAPHLKQAPARALRGNTAFTRYIAARARAIESFAQSHRIQPLWKALTEATDNLLCSAPLPKGTTLIAVGGYGRRELFPFSDVDVLILLPDAADAQQELAVVQLLQALWDQHIPVSHAARSLPETIALAQKDATVCAALMDARLLAGERKAYLALKRGLRMQVFGQQPRQFVEAKLTERDKRHARYGDSRFMLEPNIKEGKGGLRDMQTLNWLARYCYGSKSATDLVQQNVMSNAEWRHYRQAYLFFSTLRAQMHVMRGRGDDRLSFDAQPAIATALDFRGATAEQRAQRLMLRYFRFTRAVGNMTRMLCATLEEQQLRAQPPPFVQDYVARTLPHYLKVDHGRLNFADDADLLEQPHAVIGLFAAAQEHGLDIHPRAQLTLSRILPKMGKRLLLDGESNRLFLSILLSPNAPDISLRRMNEMGALPAIVPEFGKLSGQMQYDGYHTYTTDEHILVAIGNLRQLELGNWIAQHPLSTALAKESRDRAVLYTAMLCHDIAKGMGGKHAETGANVAEHVAHRFGLSADEAMLVGWLVKHHALVSDTAFKRDLDDQQTIDDFVAIVQSPERLRLLLLLTVADIKAVGPRIFNGWKGALMRTLYHRAAATMGVSAHAEADNNSAALLAQWRQQPEKPAIAITHDAFRDVTVVAICLATEPRLFTAATGVLSALGATIVSARIRQLETASMCEFHIQDVHGHSFDEDARRLKNLPQLLGDALQGGAAAAEKLAARRVIKPSHDVAVRSAVIIDNRVSASASVVEVNARDRVGLLYAILRAFDACGMQVMTAHINTYGQLAVDVFYVKDSYGHKITHHARQSQLEQALRDAIEEKQ